MIKNLDSNFAVVRHVKTNVAYYYIGDNVFVNSITGKQGEVPDEKAREIFVINLEATQILNDYPVVRELVSRFKLRIDK